MGIRKSKEENFQIKGNLNEVIDKCSKALQRGGFKKIKFNQTINQFEADYKQVIGTVWGEIKITLIGNYDSNISADNEAFKVQDDGTILRVSEQKNNNDFVNVNVVAWANVDNIYALFSSPINKILSYFKNNL